MYSILSLRGRGVGGCILVSALLVLVTGTTARGAAINVISSNVSPTPIYFGDPLFEWFLPGADLTQGSVVEVGGGLLWYIAPNFFSPPAVFQWSGSALDQDLSSGGQADGTFLAGGTMTITGQLRDQFFGLLFDGVLLEADVSAFRMTESFPSSNMINLVDGVATIHPTGGYLLTSGGMNLQGDYYLSVTGAKAQQNGGDLQDFQSDIFTVASFQFTLAQVPEPATLTMLVGGIVCVGGRRRRRRGFAT